MRWFIYWSTSAAWKVIKAMLSAQAIARIKFVTKSEIQEYINKDQLWEHMGGTVSENLGIINLRNFLVNEGKYLIGSIVLEHQTTNREVLGLIRQHH